MTDDLHKQRIKTELVAAGVTKHALHKNEAKHLPNVIHSDEHIGAAINGRTDVGSVMLVATDKRVIFLDQKSFYTTMDELSYDVVSGVAFHTQGLFSNVILHTRVGEYNLRFVNVKQAEKFVSFLESKRLENSDARTNAQVGNEDFTAIESVSPAVIDKQQRLFLQTHYVGVLSTIDRTGGVHGAVVYYLFDGKKIYFLTKSETDKARNILTHPQIAFTVFEEITYEILQVRGVSTVTSDNDQKQQVFQRITSLRNIADQNALPPVAKIQEGSFVVFEVLITDIKYSKYK